MPDQDEKMKCFKCEMCNDLLKTSDRGKSICEKCARALEMLFSTAVEELRISYKCGNNHRSFCNWMELRNDLN